MGIEQGERAGELGRVRSLSPERRSRRRSVIFADHRRGANQKLESGDRGGRDSDARAAEEFTRLFLGDVLRVVHARRPSGLDVLHGADHRDLIDYHDLAVCRTGGRLRRAHRPGVYTLERH